MLHDFFHPTSSNLDGEVERVMKLRERISEFERMVKLRVFIGQGT
jgi:hypothetical protein